MLLKIFQTMVEVRTNCNSFTSKSIVFYFILFVIGYDLFNLIVTM